MIFKEYVCPSTLEEAYEILRSHPGSVLLGGCTLLCRNTRTSPLGIDLGGLGLNQITKTGTDLILGASVSLREMETSCGDLFDGALCRAVSSLGGIPLRNVITVGGTVASRFGTSDLLTVLLALDTRLQFYHSGLYTLEEYLDMPPLRDILTEIHIPLGCSRIAFQSMRNACTDYALLNVAAADTACGLRIAVGARPMAAALSEAAADCVRRGGTPAQAAEAAAAELKFADNHRAGGAYRRELCRVLVERALKEAGI